MKFVSCASADEACIRRALRSNLERILPLFKGMKRIFILQMDEIACEERARFDKEGDEVSYIVNEVTGTQMPRQFLQAAPTHSPDLCVGPMNYESNGRTSNLGAFVHGAWTPPVRDRPPKFSVSPSRTF